LPPLDENPAAISGQPEDDLALQRATTNELQNILYSTDFATIFLDTHLNIRFFTPVTRSLFSIVAGDIGRPLADLQSQLEDDALLVDARAVLRTLAPVEREIETGKGTRFVRRITPCHTLDNKTEGVVITYVDITKSKRVLETLKEAKRQAELATAAKSRFLAAASHDLRQPLQSLALLQGLLSKAVEGAKAQELVARLDETLGAIRGMLDSLLDINQIEAGIVRAELVGFPINPLLERLGEEFTYHAKAHGLDLRVVPCSLSVHSDPHLLEQMIRNLFSNALKYTRQGKVLLGCRRRAGFVSIEVWDTGIGIPDEALQAIFEEYHQLDNDAHGQGRSFGLGLSIVQRLGELLSHRVRVRSRPDKGSAFAIEVRQAPNGSATGRLRHRYRSHDGMPDNIHRTGEILIVEDSREVRELLELLLKEKGHRATAAPDGVAALELVEGGAVRPDLVLADYDLPNRMNGLQLAAMLREKLHRRLPAIILTGDISSATSREIADEDCVQLTKPVKLNELSQSIQNLLAASPAVARARTALLALAEAANPAHQPVIHVVDDDSYIREGLRTIFEEEGWIVEDYATGEAFLEAYHPVREECLLLDAYLPGVNGLELLQRLRDDGHPLPSIMITGNSDVAIAVQAMKAGASDFLAKPIGRGELIACVRRVLDQARDATKLSGWREAATDQMTKLTERERQVLELVLAGRHNKNIAADLGISQRTVENHRASIMKKTGAKSLPALARLALSAGAGEQLDQLGSAATSTRRSAG
jgi:two-component system CheB/CheR fusion protein